MVIFSMAWTAIGITGVGEAAPQEVFTGDGVMTEKVGELCTKALPLSAVFPASGNGVVAIRRVAGISVVTGLAGSRMNLPAANIITAISAEATLNASNPRALRMYLRRRR